MSILIVDDEEVIRVLATKILQRAGFATLTADTPANGICQLTENLTAINLLILDYNLPSMSGIELLGEMRKLQSEIPCIFSSGQPIDESEVPNGLRVKTYYLQKPYKPQQLTALVQDILAKVPSGT